MARTNVKSEKFAKFLEESYQNINKDRNTTDTLLTMLMEELSRISGTNQVRSIAEIGQSAAKCIESHQRSNEQLIRLVTLLEKSSPNIDDDKINSDDIYKGLANDDLDGSGNNTTIQ